MAKNREVIAINFLTSGSYQECCKKSGITEKTLRKLRKDPQFLDLVKQTKKEMFGECMSKAQAGSIKALEVLNDIMNNPGATDASRVSAARSVLELAYDSANREDIIDRLEEMERRQNV